MPSKLAGSYKTGVHASGSPQISSTNPHLIASKKLEGPSYLG